MQQRPPRKPTPRWLVVLRLTILGLFLCMLLFGMQIAKLYTDAAWFRELGQVAVFRTALTTKLLLFFGIGGAFFLFVYSNLYLARRLMGRQPRRMVFDDDREKIAEALRAGMGWLTLGASAVLAFLVAGHAVTHWPTYLQFTHGVPFGDRDPVFNHDVAFYLFRLPFLEYLQGLLLFTLGVTAIGVALIYVSENGAEMLTGGTPTVPGHMRAHLLVLAGLFAFTVAWGHLLARYDLLTSENGAFFGAGYTDLHARLPGQHIQAALMLFTGLLCFLNLRAGKPFRLPIVGLVLWAVVSAVVVGFWPSFVQRFRVVPNQFLAEKQYIERDIQMTRKAYGLDRVKERMVEVKPELTKAELESATETINNIRLWDWPQLGMVYTVKQSLRPYYRFKLPPNATFTSGDYNIDVARYHLGGRYQQVMLAPREMDTDGLTAQAQTWQNQRLIYTHGYGVVMSPVNAVDSEGLPEYFMHQIPVRVEVPDLKLDRPEIYYGELASDYVFVGTKQAEFDYPAGEGNVETRYAGKGGVPIGGAIGRLAWAARLGDTNMLLARDVDNDSRLLFRRGIRDRVMTLAPFLNLDNDPYLVVNNGRLVWILDAYTVSSRYPYSRPVRVGVPGGAYAQQFNYIRNAVKATVDAYDGTVTLYIADSRDPVIRTWARAFPTLFKPLEEMPEPLRAHVRYPEDMFRIQRDIFQLYHISDARVYYGKEDQWAVPIDPTAEAENGGGPTRMQPYYVMMRLPGDKQQEFLLISPYTPNRRDTLSAWLAARCDPANYGELVLFRFPKGTPINGPAPIMNQIRADSDVSRIQTLLGQRGSQVIYGNLLIIPIENSLLYVVPMYVQATGAAGIVPDLRYVIVASGEHVVVRSTLNEAIAALGDRTTGKTTRSQPIAASTPATEIERAVTLPTPAGDPMQRASEALQRARRIQRDYGAALDDLESAIKELQKRQGGGR